MRNLKRALSLTLASVMLLGMMVLGTSAAVAYPDVTDEHNVEAIEVLQAVGVMSGSNNGNFNPDSKISRIEMAIVMSNLLDLDPDYFQGQNTFSDVPEWASGYVNACAANGIVTGVGGGRFGTGNVTATQAALMMLKALGYFQYNSDFGGDWARATANQAAKIRLFDGIDVRDNTQLTRNQVAQLALNAIESGMVDADNSGTINVVTPDGTTVTNGSVNYVYRSSTQSFANQINTTEQWNTSALVGVTGSVIELGEQLYNGNLKRYDDTNNFGAPSVRWTYKNSEIGNYADEADYKFEGEVKSNAMYSAVGKTAAENYLWTVKMDGQSQSFYGTSGTPAKPNEPMFTGADVADNDKDTLDGTKRGAVTYVYLDDDEVRVNGTTYSGTATVCIVNTYAAEVTKVDGDTVTLDDMNDSGLEYDVAGYAEEDVVLYTKSVAKNGDWTVESVLGKAELIEGKADTIRNADRVVIGDTTYRYSYRFFDGDAKKLDVDSVNENVAFYLDQQGNIIMLADATESNDYAYVYSVGNASSKYGDDAEYGAKLILTDGTKKNVDIDKDDTDAWTKLSGLSSNKNKLDALKYGAASSDSGSTWTAKAEGTAISVTGDVTTGTNRAKAPLVGQIVSYTEEDGLYSLEIKTTHYAKWTSADTNVLKSGNSRIDISGADKVNDKASADAGRINYVYTDKNSAILLNPDYETDADKYEVYTGYENAPDTDATYSAAAGQPKSTMTAYVKDGVVKAVYMADANIKGTSKAVFVIGADNPKENGTGSNKYFVYDAVVDGEIKSIRVKSGSAAKTALDNIAKGQLGVFFGITENSSGYVTRLTTAVPTDVEVNGTTSNTNNKWTAYEGVSRETTDGLLGFGWNDGTKEYDVRPAANKDAKVVYYDGNDLSVEGLHTDRNDKAWVVTDEGVVTDVFVWEVKDTTGGGSEPDPEDEISRTGMTFIYSVADKDNIPDPETIRDAVCEELGFTFGGDSTDSFNQEDSITYTLKVNKSTYTIVLDLGSKQVTAQPTDVAGVTAILNNDGPAWVAMAPVISTGITQTVTPQTDGSVKVALSGTIAAPEAKASGTNLQNALNAYSTYSSGTPDGMESLYDLADGKWGFVVVELDGRVYELLVGVRSASPTHATGSGYAALNTKSEGFVMRQNGDSTATINNGDVWFVSSRNITVNGVTYTLDVSGLTYPS